MVMDISVVSLIVTVIGTIFGAIGIYFFIISKKYPGQITFAKEDCIGLVDSIIRNLPNLNITYKEESISDRIVLLKGYLVNTGKIDIKRDMVNSPIMLYLPENYRWLDVKQVSSSIGLVADIHILPDNNRNIKFEFELFKREEFVQFEALAEVPENKSKKPSSLMEKAIGFTSRISDTDRIKSLDLEPDYMKQTNAEMKNIAYIMIILAFLFSILTIYILLYDAPCEIQYNLLDSSGDIIAVTISPKMNGAIKVKGVNNHYSEIITPEDFFSRNNLKPIVVKNKTITIVLIFGSAFIWFAAFSSINSFWQIQRKQKRIVKILTLD
jgi:hypothetical protein